MSSVSDLSNRCAAIVSFGRRLSAPDTTARFIAYPMFSPEPSSALKTWLVEYKELPGVFIEEVPGMAVVRNITNCGAAHYSINCGAPGVISSQKTALDFAFHVAISLTNPPVSITLPRYLNLLATFNRPPKRTSVDALRANPNVLLILKVQNTHLIELR